MRDDVGAFVSWFLAGIATALAGGIVFVLTRNLALAALTGLSVLGLLRLVHPGD